MALPTKLGKEISTGTSTAAIIDASLHGTHPVLVVVIIGGFLVAGIFHYIEGKIEAKNENKSTHQRGVRNYGLTRLL